MPAKLALQVPTAQSASDLHRGWHTKLVSLPSCEQAWSLQHSGAVAPQVAPVVPQPHQRASAQKPLVPLVYILQQPVEHSLLVVHGRRHPSQSETVVPVLQTPVQHSEELVQVAATFPQDEVQREAFEQTAWPLLSSSKQHPEGQSALVLHGRWQIAVPGMHVSPSQHGLLAQDASVAAQRPATAPGPSAQFGYCLAAAPVQKHEASSKLMQV